MRVITVPEAIVIEGKSVDLKSFLVDALDAYVPAGKSVKMLRQVAKIVGVIDGSNGHISLEDADYDVVKASLHFEGDAGSWNPRMGRRVLSFFDAVESAEVVKK